MRVKLVRIMTKMMADDFDGSILAKYSKDVELLMEPRPGMKIRTKNVEFYIGSIVQDLNTQNILLHERKNIYNEDQFRKEKQILSNNGWKLYN
jgi:hypothetical protein